MEGSDLTVFSSIGLYFISFNSEHSLFCHLIALFYGLNLKVFISVASLLIKVNLLTTIGVALN